MFMFLHHVVNHITSMYSNHISLTVHIFAMLLSSFILMNYHTIPNIITVPRTFC